MTTVLACQAALAVTYHLGPKGSDANPGSADLPLASIEHALQIVRAGDTVIVHDGVYPVVREIRPQQSGEADNWITFRGADGERPILDGANEYARPDSPRNGYIGMIELANVSYLRFIGIELRNAWAFGFRIGGDPAKTHHLELLNCRVDRSYASAIWLGRSENCRVIGCDITHANDMDARMPGTRRPSEAPQEAISIARARNFEVAYNRVYRCYKEGIDCKETSSHGSIHHNEVYQCARQGLYVDCWFGLLEDVEFSHNVVRDCEWGFGISAEGRGASMKNIRFHHNAIYNNRASGVFFGRWGTDGPRSQIYIYNNTIWRNGSIDHWAGTTGGVDIRAQNLDEVVIANNIIFGNTGFEIATFAEPKDVPAVLASKRITIANNLTSPFHDEITGGGMFNRPYACESDKSVVGDPRFALPRLPDLRLLPGSPALGKADRQLIPFDSATADLGAYPEMQPKP